MFYKYLVFSVSIAFISWIVGLFVIAFIREKEFYKENLSNLNFIRSEFLNKIIGVGIIKWIVKNTFFKFFNPRLQLKKSSKSADLKTIRDEMTAAETGHLVGFIFVSFFAIAKFLKSEYLFGFIIMAVNIIMNLYPSLLQQKNKRRVDKILSRRN